jgi:hypothetical protein
MWVLESYEIEGSPLQPATFHALLTRVSTTVWPHPVYQTLPVHLCGIDSGFCASQVYAAVKMTMTDAKPRPPWLRTEWRSEGGVYFGTGGSTTAEFAKRWVFAMKGEAGAPGESPVLPRKDRADHWIRMNGYALTIEWLERLKLPTDARGAVHLPKWVKGTDLLKQFTAEELKPIFNADGVEVDRRFIQVYDKNEALDCAKIALALWHSQRQGPGGQDQLFRHYAQLVGDRDRARRDWLAVYPYQVRG